MRKYYLTLLVMAIFAIGFAASDDSSSSSSTAQSEQKGEQPKVNMSLVGTYEATDFDNAPLHIILKENETAEVYWPKNHDRTYYAHWEEVRGGIQVCYDNTVYTPHIRYPWGTSADTEASSRCFYISSGWMYPCFLKFDQRNDGWRIPVVKIK